MKPMMANPIAVAMAIFWNSFLSGFVHLLTSLTESLENCLRGSTNCTIWSILSLEFVARQPTIFDKGSVFLKNSESPC